MKGFRRGWEVVLVGAVGVFSKTSAVVLWMSSSTFFNSENVSPLCVCMCVCVLCMRVCVCVMKRGVSPFGILSFVVVPRVQNTHQCLGSWGGGIF